MNHISYLLRLLATICFVLAIFGVSPYAIPLGLALWCGSTLIPPPGPQGH